MPVWLLTCAGAAGDPGEGEQVGGQSAGRDAAARGSEIDLGDDSGADQAFKSAGVVEAEFHVPEDAVRAGEFCGWAVVPGDDTTSAGAYCATLNR